MDKRMNVSVLYWRMVFWQAGLEENRFHYVHKIRQHEFAKLKVPSSKFNWRTPSLAKEESSKWLPQSYAAAVVWFVPSPRQIRTLKIYLYSKRARHVEISSKHTGKRTSTAKRRYKGTRYIRVTIPRLQKYHFPQMWRNDESSPNLYHLIHYFGKSTHHVKRQTCTSMMCMH